MMGDSAPNLEGLQAILIFGSLEVVLKSILNVAADVSPHQLGAE
jgi:hypothetical protein